MKRMQKQTRAMGKRTMASKLAYVKKNWQLAVICVFPDAGTYINHYIQVSSNGGTADCV